MNFIYWVLVLIPRILKDYFRGDVIIGIEYFCFSCVPEDSTTTKTQ